MKHRNNFDALRLIASLMVLVSHQFPIGGHAEPTAIGAYTFGTLGVLIFFSISGFLITSSWTREPDIRPFLYKRALRIWPALAVNVVLLAVIVTVLQPDLWHRALRFAWHNLIFVRDGGHFVSGNPFTLVNGPLWTIPIEVFCYIFLAALAIFLGRHLPRVLPLGLLAFAVYIACLSEPQIRQAAQKMNDPTYVPWLCATFMAGALLHIRPNVNRLAPLLGFAGLLLIVLGRTSAGLLLLAPILVVNVGRRSWPVLNRFDRFGDLSYGVYLWAWPVQQLVVLLTGTQAPLPLQLALSVAGTLALAYASWHLVEKRALRLKDKLTFGARKENVTA